MNKINKFIVIALAALLLQSCASELEIQAHKTSNVYEKAEFLNWDRLVKQKEEEIERRKVSMMSALRVKSDHYRLLRAYQIMLEDYSILTIDDVYVNWSALGGCLRPKSTLKGRVLKLNKPYRSVRILRGKEFIGLLQDDVWSYVECTERQAPGIVIDESSDWHSVDLILDAKSNILLNYLGRRTHMVFIPN
jgi:hypothetical protein